MRGKGKGKGRRRSEVDHILSSVLCIFSASCEGLGIYWLDGASLRNLLLFFFLSLLLHTQVTHGKYFFSFMT